VSPTPARLLLGPLLRYVGGQEATLWVQTDRACSVQILGTSTPTFSVAGHHYAIVCVSGLTAGTVIPYEVHLDGVRCWPPDDSPYPPSVIRPPGHEQTLRVAFGSCRVSVPNEPPYALTKDQDARGREVDALLALGHRLRHQDPGQWPDILLLLGDQVYADEVSPATQARNQELRRAAADPDLEPPPDDVADFAEYTRLYHEAWSDPATRWLLSTVPSAMIFDDHDVHDDWNTSQAWVDEIRRKPWWQERIIGAYMSYWIYQHLGNLSPAALARDATLTAVRESAGDATGVLRAFAQQSEQEIAGTRWSFHRDLGRTRLIVLDSRAGRVLQEDRRDILSDREWAWAREQMGADVDHLLIATTLPWLLSPGLHHLEAWNEAVCGGAWGRRAAHLGERTRQALDLEHWAAFQRSFRRLADLVHEVASGARGPAPASIVVLSGDVHHAYLAKASFPGRAPVTSAVVQAVCSPIRNPLDRRERRMLRAALSRPAIAGARWLARRAGVPSAAIAWDFVEEPTFDNQVGLLDLHGRRAHLRIQKTRPEDWQDPQLHETLSRAIC
jgi:hypothetical protein